MSSGTTYFDCFLQPPDFYKGIILSFVSKYVQGQVLEIGAGATPWYWASAYIHKVNSVVFTDIREDFLKSYEDFVQTITNEKWQTVSVETLALLYKKSLIPEDRTASAILEDLVTKTSVQTASFATINSVPGVFDTVLSIEAIECVHTYKELAVAFSKIYNKLKLGGCFAAVVLPYAKKDQRIDSLIQQGLEGTLNPDTAMIRQAGMDAGFSDISIEKKATGKKLYPQVLCVVMKKSINEKQ